MLMHLPNITQKHFIAAGDSTCIGMEIKCLQVTAPLSVLGIFVHRKGDETLAGFSSFIFGLHCICLY